MLGCVSTALRRLLPVALACGLAALANAEPLALRIERPLPGTTTRLPLVEVVGGAGRGAQAGWDVAVVLDVSESTLHASGLDLDSDGPDGRSDPALLERLVPSGFAGPGLARRLAEIDFEDTILAAELEAASALLARTAGPGLRSGLIAFSDQARVLAPLGSPPAASERALAELRAHLGEYLRGTHYAAAIEAAQRMLVPTPDAVGDGRQRAIVFLSDGAPSLPVRWGDAGRRPALEAARAAGLDGIRIFGFAFGEGGAAATEVLAEMARWTDGRAQRVEQPEQLVSALRELQLADVARVSIRNETTDEAARAVRVFPDGSFDGLVPLAEGENVVRVEAYGSDGSGVYLERKLRRLPGAADAGEAALGRELLAELRQRTAEMEAWAAVERRRQEQRRSLSIEPLRKP
jgi:von Willebrand factor type A domain